MSVKPHKNGEKSPHISGRFALPFFAKRAAFVKHCTEFFILNIVNVAQKEGDTPVLFATAFHGRAKKTASEFGWAKNELAAVATEKKLSCADKGKKKFELYTENQLEISVSFGANEKVRSN